MANDFLVFDETSTNIMSQANYAAASHRVNGVVPGVGDSLLANKSWRQASVVSSMIGQFVFDETTHDAVDNGTIHPLLEDFKLAILNQVKTMALGGVLTGFLPNPGMAAGAAVANIGFTPVQQGGGAGQGTNKLYMGWAGSGLRVQVDSTDVGTLAFLERAQSWNATQSFQAVNATTVSVSSSINAATVHTTGNISADATVTGATVNSTGAMNASGTITGATVNSNGNVNAAGNVNATGTHTGGAVSVTGNINANGQVRGVGGIMSPGGIFYVVDNLNYYVGRGGDGAWRFVENGNPTFTIDSSGNATAAGSLYGGTVTSAGDTHVGNSIVIQHDVIFANATNPGRSSLFGTGDLGSLILNKSGGGEEAIRGYQSIGETQIIANGVIGLRITNNGDGYFIGNVYGAGFNPSDTRIKEQSEPYTRGLADVLRLMPKTYKLMRDPDGPWHVSVDAQALLQTIPEAVAERDCTQQDGLSDQLFIQPDFVHYAALNAIKELSEMVDTLTARVAALEEAGVIAERRWRVGA